MENIFSQFKLFAQAGDAILLSDVHGQIIVGNRSACEYLGYSAVELSGLKLNDIEGGAVTETGLLEVGLCATTFRCADGSEFPVEVQVSTIHDPQQGDCLLLIARDTSARSLEETRLLDQNTLLNNILTNIPHSIYWKDRNLIYAGCNDNFARDVGLESPEQLVGRTVDNLPRRSEEALLFQQCDQEVMTKDFPLLDFEEQRLQDDGSMATLLTSRVPLKDAAGRITGLLGIYTDITERRLAETALEKSENRHKKLSQEFQAVLNGIPDSLMLLAPDLQVIWANQSTAGHLNQEFSTIPGSYCYQLWDHSTSPCRECVAKQSFASGETAEAMRQLSDGRVWGIKAFPIKDTKGQVVNVIHLASDITEKKKLREEADRSGRLAALGELSAGVAHEINNPNGLVLLNLPLLEDAFADALPILDTHFREQGGFQMAGLPYSQMRDEIPRLLSELNEGASRIRQIVDDLKNFVRKDPRNLKEPFDLRQSIEKVVRLVGNVLKDSTENFSCHYAAALPLAGGNAQQIEQVILNLLLNACHALPNRQRGIELRTSIDAQGENLVVEVKDQGRGIAASDLSSVTDPFFTTRREQGGTGLGLSIAARIVKEHAGSLQFKSTPDIGTTVTLTLPRSKG